VIAAAVRALPLKRIMIDGEAVAHCPDGLPHFHGLMDEDRVGVRLPQHFDLLFLEAQDLRDGGPDRPPATQP
jgi:ATP-dependent DNA ligase